MSPRYLDLVDAQLAHGKLKQLRAESRVQQRRRYFALKRLKDSGLTCREIEDRTGVPKSTVSYVLNNPEEWYESGEDSKATAGRT